MSVVTFYSFKGGVGRTQAVANVAAELSGRGKRVIIVDMDLESPGVLAYFGRAKEGASQPGLLEYLDAWRSNEAPPNVDEFLIEVLPNVRVMGPGRLDRDYARRVAALSWERFYEEEHGELVMERLREELLARADVVLLDSRTGMTDVGTVCTWYLPDTVVALFALHQQGIDGTALVARALAERMKEGESRLKRVLLVPARVEEADGSLVTEWIGKARAAFEGFPASIGVVEALDRTTFRVPYDRDVAYGEHVVVQTAREGRLAVAYRFLADVLLGEAPSTEDVEVAAWEEEAERLSRVGRAEQALLLMRRVVARWGERSAERPDNLDVRAELARSMANLAVELSRAGRRVDAARTGDEAAKHYRVLAASEPRRYGPDLAQVLTNLSAAERGAGRYVEALRASEASILEYRRLGSSEPERYRIELAMGLGNLANALNALERKEEALAASAEATAMFRQANLDANGGHRAELATALNIQAHQLLELGREEEALVALKEAVEHHRGLAAEDADFYSLNLCRSLNNLATGLAQLGRWEEALAAVSEGVDRQAAADGTWERREDEFVRALATQAGVLTALGRPKEAITAVEAAIPLIRPQYEQLPQVFESLAGALVATYLSACAALNQPPDEALLAGLPRPE